MIASGRGRAVVCATRLEDSASAKATSSDADATSASLPRTASETSSVVVVSAGVIMNYCAPKLQRMTSSIFLFQRATATRRDHVTTSVTCTTASACVSTPTLTDASVTSASVASTTSLAACPASATVALTSATTELVTALTAVATLAVASVTYARTVSMATRVLRHRLGVDRACVRAEQEVVSNTRTSVDWSRSPTK